jgi:hypothetical protein
MMKKIRTVIVWQDEAGSEEEARGLPGVIVMFNVLIRIWVKAYLSNGPLKICTFLLCKLYLKKNNKC